MKSLVTGGAGFIGSHIVDNLLKLDHEVIVIDNEYSNSHDQFYWNNKAKNYKLDIRDYENTRPLYNDVDYVFHLAAQSSIQPSIENPIEAVNINTIGTCTVLQCSREAKVKRVMYSSTSAAYGTNKIPNVETQPDICLNPYSISKVSGEKLCTMYTNLYGLPTIIFRYFNVYGERQPIRGQYAPVIGIFLRQKKLGEPLTIVGDGNQSRDFIYVGDVANANVIAAVKDVNFKSFGQVYNIGTEINYSVNDIAKMFNHPMINISPRLGELKVSLANSKKMKKTFDWEPLMNLENWITSQL